MRIIIPRQDYASLLDPSELHRPEEKYQDLKVDVRMKLAGEKFRNYEDNIQTDQVKQTYKLMHENMTYDFVQKKIDKWTKFNHAEMGLMEAIFLLDNLVDQSDPDTDLPNSVHAFQTAERIRKVHPDKEWFHLTGLLHDAGKVMALWGEPQWCVVGDTFPVGAQFRPSCVFSEYFQNNEDAMNEEYSTLSGIYKENCGLDNVTMSWGHDEYMYRMLRHNNTTLPKEALYAVRYHSFYPYHSGNDYQYLANEEDADMLKWVLEFNKFDLYSKVDEAPNVQELKSYYQSLIDKYIPGVLKW